MARPIPPPPFPYFGGKRKIAPEVWRRFRGVNHYIEPFCGSCAVMLHAPESVITTTINDADGFVINFWRAVAYAPAAVAKFANWPVIEADLYARHNWLLERRKSLLERLYTDPHYYDAQTAGYWAWGASAWIGTGWGHNNAAQMPLVSARGSGVNRPQSAARSLTRALSAAVMERYMSDLSDHLSRARICCGDWSRVVTESALIIDDAIVGVFFDPPYGDGNMSYAAGGNDDTSIAAAVWKWAVENGDRERLKIAVCGYQDGRAVPEGWSVYQWKAYGGYANQSGKTRGAETVWFSPHCYTPDDYSELPMFQGL